MKAPRILCVESYESLQVARRMILERAGYCVQVAASCNEAITKARQLAFDVVVICGCLGDSEGEQLAGNLRTISPTTRVILLNSSLAAVPGGSDSPEILLASIRAALNATRPASEAHRKTA